MSASTLAARRLCWMTPFVTGPPPPHEWALELYGVEGNRQAGMTMLTVTNGI